MSGLHLSPQNLARTEALSQGLCSGKVLVYLCKLTGKLYYEVVRFTLMTVGQLAQYRF